MILDTKGATPANRLRAVKELIRNPYAWPGGYPQHLITTDGGCLCVKCCKAEFRNIASGTIYEMNDGWRAEAVAINWEDSELVCDNCAANIESAYGEGN